MKWLKKAREGLENLWWRVVWFVGVYTDEEAEELERRGLPIDCPPPLGLLLAFLLGFTLTLVVGIQVLRSLGLLPYPD